MSSAERETPAALLLLGRRVLPCCGRERDVRPARLPLGRVAIYHPPGPRRSDRQGDQRGGGATSDRPAAISACDARSWSHAPLEWSTGRKWSPPGGEPVRCLPALRRLAQRERQALRGAGAPAGGAGRSDRHNLEVALAVADALGDLRQFHLQRPRDAWGEVVTRVAELEGAGPSCEVDGLGCAQCERAGAVAARRQRAAQPDRRRVPTHLQGAAADGHGAY